eukprot:CAMPEP_0181299354 /NCGR_PEP_ID=MMETSP1101-20121128/6300_1 /TAXON_ID=46948 /ORGANISM="Rhodomonas abbreviata, Strain Caron Lab Isolate" /LENGTH=1896 /DNA_ID=CAMNT_0023404495 /DNA_START=86 /DNA_END=5776 /DNA_ORIENTATION=+
MAQKMPASLLRDSRWKSVHELLLQVRAITPDEQHHSPEKLDAVLNDILATWPKLSLNLLTSVFLNKFKMSLSAAVLKLEQIGFGRHVKGFRSEAVTVVALHGVRKRLGFSLRWFLQDFELILAVWSGLEDEVREWLAKEFLRFWQSHSGEEELRAGGVEKQYGTNVLRFKVIWNHGDPPSLNRKLEPAKAIGLGWGFKELEELLQNFVDLTSDCHALVEELQNSDFLQPALVNAHEGLLSACVDICPDFLVGEMLAGRIFFPEPRVEKTRYSTQKPTPPQASLILRLIKVFHQVLVGGRNGEELTEQHAKHLKHFLKNVVGICAHRSIAMYQAQEYVVDLALCLTKQQGMAMMLRHISAFYIGASAPSKPSVWAGSGEVGESVSRCALVPISKQEREENPGLVRAEREVDSFCTLLSALLDHPRALDISTLVQIENCKRIKVDAALQCKLHTWTLKKIAEGMMDSGNGGDDRDATAAGRSYHASTLKKWFLDWVQPNCDGVQACEVWRAMAEGLDSWLFVLDIAVSLGETSFSKRPAAEQALVACVYEFAKRRLTTCKEHWLASENILGMGKGGFRQQIVSSRQAILKTLLRLHPQQFAQDFDVRTYLDVRDLGRGEVPFRLFQPIQQERKLCSRTLVGHWQSSLDSFTPVAFFKRSFVHASGYAPASGASYTHLSTIEKTKTKEQWDEVVKVVAFVTPELLTDGEIAQRLATILCAVWSNHGVWSTLCTEFFGKLSKAALLWSLQDNATGQADSPTTPSPSPSPSPGEVLVNFSLKCPHDYFLSSTSKKDWIISMLPHARADDRTLSLLFAAHCGNSAQDLVELIHASGVTDLHKDTEDLLFTKLLPQYLGADTAKPQNPLREQVQLLLSCRFTALASLRTADRRCECVEWGGVEFWEELESGGAGQGDVHDFAMLSESEGAVEDEEVTRAEQDNRTSRSYKAESSVYRTFGEPGEQVVLGFLETAAPSDLVQLFRTFGNERLGSFLCGGPEDLLLKAWRPKQCLPEEAGDMVALVVVHVPHLWSRCAQLVWGQAELEVSDVNSELMRTLLFGRVPQLEMLPQRWWHCIHVSKLALHCVTTLKDEGPLQRLVEAGVPVALDDLKQLFSSGCFSLSMQMLLLDRFAASDVLVLAEFLALFQGPILGYLKRLFWLLDEDQATRQCLLKMGDGVEEEEKFASGWNKVVNVLLVGLRVRSRDGEDKNWLHSEEQLALFAYCCEKTRFEGGAEEQQDDAIHLTMAKFPKWLLSQSNASVLSDLLETKCVDPMHVGQVVSFVLSAVRPQVVRDSALRAMLRLDAAERNVLIDKLLASPRKLPMQVLFALTVTHLNEHAVPSVVQRLQELTEQEIAALLDLIRDANPSGASHVHTFPRKAGVQDALAERFLVRYVAGDPVDAGQGAHSKQGKRVRDDRFLHLFLACCKPQLVPRYLLDLLDRHLLVVSPLLLCGFEPLPARRAASDLDAPEAARGDADSLAPVSSHSCELSDFVVLLEHLGAAGLQQYLPWIWQQVLAANAAGKGLIWLHTVLSYVVGGGNEATAHDGAFVSFVLQDVIDWSSRGGGGHAETSSKDRNQNGNAGEFLRSVPGAAELVYAVLLAVSPHNKRAGAGRGETAALSGVGPHLQTPELCQAWGSAALPVQLTRSNHASLCTRFLASTWALEERAGAEACAEVVATRSRQLAEAMPHLLVKELRSKDLSAQSPTGEAARTMPNSAWWDPQAVQSELPRDLMRRLGVDHPARMLCLQLNPPLALSLWAAEILAVDASLAVSLSDDHFRHMAAPLTATSSNDQAWPLIRDVIAALQDARACKRALRLAIELVKQSHEQRDFGLLKAAYLGISATQRRQTALLAELRCMWPKFGALLQDVVDAGAQLDGPRTGSLGVALEGEWLKRMDLIE